MTGDRIIMDLNTEVFKNNHIALAREQYCALGLGSKGERAIIITKG